MDDGQDPGEVAALLLAGVSVLLRRVRQMPAPGGLTMPERGALSHLERSGPTTSSALAREVQITAQAMGTTMGALRARGLVERRPDPDDGRRGVLTVTDAGRRALQDKRDARTEVVARALAGGAFTAVELERLAAAAPLLERLARTI
ncbi:putative MarR family transcriptional regulator [Actinacidiphila reveromycinica]|uniref:Putative MarR family transcriptional regulator n=1 Tax=Actinacidiphila reveromycinica TaxID=659352 RepID=A0A7U3V0L4_9ACTN|nr:MarR family transcriptional regulator [Streptomyces sp. SN-593]BBB02097.1 putative MarR family transcriptional regulator [Streptomyces sp. SN-593]